MIYKKLLTIAALGVFGYGCVAIGKIIQTYNMGKLYRMTELGDEQAAELLERASDYAMQLDGCLAVLKKKIRG